MYLRTWKSVAAIVVLVAVSGAGLAFGAYQVFGKVEAAEPVAVVAPDKPAPDKPPPDPNDKLRQEVKGLQGRLKAIQERQKLEKELKRLKDQIAVLEGKPIAGGKLPRITYQGKNVDHWLLAVRDCDPTTRMSGLQALAAMGDELSDDAARVATVITSILKPDLDLGAPFIAGRFVPGTVQAQAIEVLALLGASAKPAIPKLVELQLGAREDIHEPLSAALVRIDPDGATAIPLLQAALQEPKLRKHVVTNALVGLRTYKEKAAPGAPAIIQLLRVAEDPVRYEAYVTLKGMKDDIKKAALPALIALSKDKDKDTAEAAAGVLRDLYPQEAQDANVPKANPPANLRPEAPSGGPGLLPLFRHRQSS